MDLEKRVHKLREFIFILSIWVAAFEKDDDGGFEIYRPEQPEYSPVLITVEADQMKSVREFLKEISKEKSSEISSLFQSNDCVVMQSQPGTSVRISQSYIEYLHDVLCDIENSFFKEHFPCDIF